VFAVEAPVTVVVIETVEVPSLVVVLAMAVISFTADIALASEIRYTGKRIDKDSVTVNNSVCCGSTSSSSSDCNS